ncbi:TonB-dependent receptor [Flavihumibacter petaseus]|uniref:Putative TonB-dependent receptor n=1 Tax=Flavihumibacter petaseus NBRC 106054 TaxID=1220578 RepID=A0A0E9N235_9BACT|nr:TonB-dependent receptor [Flavihumibacter petaseus]GAO43370.1 putative TonB-dependent receptor [Flavihumibacter petaseus NBRC 106054]
MKIAALLMLACCLQVSAKVYSQKITLAETNAALETILEKIEKQTGYTFAYTQSLISSARKSTVNVRNATLEETLKLCFSGQPFTYSVIDKTIVIQPRQQESGTVKLEQPAAPIEVRGNVTTENGSPLAGASVRLKGTDKGTTTDESGAFKLEIPEGGGRLQISYIGHQTTELHVTKSGTFNVVLKLADQKVDEVVVVAYGTQKKLNLTGSISSVGSKEIEDRPVTSTANALQGKMAGVTVTTTNGQPGRDAGTIRIRGIGTLNNSDPMVVVDGVIASMSEVNPNDIENVTVLKDAASAAIYGSRAANGVILITTKRGKKGQLQLNYSGYVGKQDVHRLPDFLPAWQQAELYNEALANEGKSPKWSAEDIRKFKDGSDPTHPNTDWLDLFYTEPGFQQNHYLNVSGGDGKTQYMASVGYFDQQGNVKGSSFTKYSTRFNLNSKINEKLSFNTNLAYQHAPFSEPVSTYATGFSQLVRMVNRISNTVPYKYPNGAYGYVADGSPMAWLEAGSYNKTTGDILTTNFGLDWEIIKDLHFRPGFSYRSNSGRRQQFVKDIQYYSGSTGEPTKYQGPNNLIESSDKTTYTNLQAILEYQKTIAKNHQVKITLGATQEQQVYNYLYAYRQGFLNNTLTELNAAPKDGQQNEGYSQEWALQSYFGRLNYDYKGRYLLEADLRRDGSSRFAEGNRWSVFPSFSAGWNISRESFFERLLPIVNSLKLRGSWGQLGNQNVVGYYPTYATISTGVNYSFNQTLASGIAPKNGANSDIQWEATTTTDIGMDATFFRNKLQFTADYFTRKTSDILLNLPVGAVYGLTSPYQNAGAVSNSGWEFSAGYRNQFREVTYDVAANIAFIKNEVNDLKGSGPYISGGTFTDVGYPINSLYGYICDGIFQTQEEIDNHATQSGGKIEPGDLIYRDISGPSGKPDGVIDGNDRTYLGTYFPKITYGLTLGAQWKGIELSVFFQGAGGVKVASGNLIGEVGPDVNKPTSVYLDRWTADNPSTAFPRLSYGYKQNSPTSTPSSFWVKDASYLRLKNLLVAYNLPARFVNKVGLKNVKLYYSGQNILTITNFYKWIDPEVGSTGSIYSYPQVVVNSFGINVGF